MRVVIALIIINFLTAGTVSAQSKFVFKIKKQELDGMDTIVPCHNKLFYAGSLESSKPNLKGFGYHYHNISFTWIDFKTSKFYLVRDSGAVITENHTNGHRYWLETDNDLYEKEYQLYSFNTDTTKGLWKGRREDTISRKEVIKTEITLKNCEIRIAKTTGFYKKQYLYTYTVIDPITSKEEQKWKFTLRSPLITWIIIGEVQVSNFKDKLTNKVLKPYKFAEI